MVVRKAAHMAGHMNTPLVGVVENMSYAVCPHCGEKHEIFGPSHAEEAAAMMNLPLLGRLPLDSRLATLTDQGAIEDHPLEAFAPIADELLKRVPEEKTEPKMP